MKPVAPDLPRLAQLMFSKQEGGAEMFFEKLASAFAQTGVEQELIIEPLADRLTRLDQQGLPYRTLRFGGWREPFARYRLRCWLHTFKPQILLSWMNRASRRMPAGPFVKIARLGGYYKLKHYRHCDYLIVNTPDLKHYVIQNGWAPARVRVISNFGETPVTRPGSDETLRAELGVSENTFLIVSLGRLHSNKAFDVLLQAAKEVPRACFVIAGRGPLETELKALCRRLQVENRVFFLGWRDDASRLLKGADLCVFPSRREPLGNVILEAWANGTAIIATETAGPAWLIEDGVHGALVPVDDPRTLAASINHHLDHPEIRNRYAAEGYRKFQEQFSREAIVRQYLDFFRETLAQG